MPSKATSAVGKAAIQRLTGGKPGPMTAFIASAIVGIAVGVATYRALRRGR